MKTPLIALFTFLMPLTAFAADKVIYFGGATAQKAALDRCFPQFENHGYPADGDIAGVIARINQNPQQTYVVAGHSSGAKYANAVASGKIVNPERITLIDLDGYAPRSVPKNIKKVCWNAAGGNGGKLKSRNFDSMTTGNGCNQVNTHQDQHCSTVWCMHFSIVNPGTPANLNDGSWVGHGYDGCSQANVPWLKQ